MLIFVFQIGAAKKNKAQIYYFYYFFVWASVCFIDAHTRTHATNHLYWCVYVCDYKVRMYSADIVDDELARHVGVVCV